MAEHAQAEELKFLVGVAISVFQNSGDPHSNWGHFEQLKGKIVGGARCGNSCDFWNHYERDLQLAKDIGCNGFRVSLEWSRIEPQRGKIDEEAIAHYHAMFDVMDRLGITPTVTLHHFTHPQWFEELGSFTQHDNIPIFLEWAQLAFTRFGSRCKLWATFNEPGVATMCGYLLGSHPPGRRFAFYSAGMHMLGMLKAHAAAYKLIKSLPGGDQVQVGLVHNVFWFEPTAFSPLMWHSRIMAALGNRVWANDSVVGYLKTGRFEYWRPVGANVRYEDPAGPPGLDFFGLNHYSRGIVDWKLSPSHREGEVMADMGYPIYPPSIYRAIAYVAQLGAPIYVMENGIPDTADDAKRTLWIKGYLYQVQRAVADGYDVRGYFYWTLMDNFEWNFAFTLRFGLYEYDPDDPAKQRRLREGAKCIVDIYRALPQRLGRLLAQQQEARRRAALAAPASPTSPTSAAAFAPAPVAGGAAANPAYASPAASPAKPAAGPPASPGLAAAGVGAAPVTPMRQVGRKKRGKRHKDAALIPLDDIEIPPHIKELDYGVTGQLDWEALEKGTGAGQGLAPERPAGEVVREVAGAMLSPAM